MLQLGKEEREKQNGLKAKVFFNRAMLFCHLRHLEDVSGFRIDNRTIKRGIFNCNGYLVPLSVSLFCICIALSDVVKILEKALTIICKNANLSAQLFLVLRGKVSTLKRGFELENRASNAQTARGRSELFTALPGYSMCLQQRGVDRNYFLPARTGNFLVL